jgi:hypothetical protein
MPCLSLEKIQQLAETVPALSKPRSGEAASAPPRGGLNAMARLKRDAPDVLERFLRGEIPSIKAARRLAGFMRGSL